MINQKLVIVVDFENFKSDNFGKPILYESFTSALNQANQNSNEQIYLIENLPGELKRKLYFLLNLKN